MKASNFYWRSCKSAQPIVQGFTNIDTGKTVELFDFGNPSVTQSTMSWNQFTFTEVYCHVNTYQLKCIDPENENYVIDSLNNVVSGSSTKCSKFVTNLSSRTISANIDDFE